VKICVPTDGDEGLAAAVSAHLGRAPFLTLVDTETREVTVLPNAPHGDGRCEPAQPLSGSGVEAVVCGGAGKRAVESLRAAGIRVLLTGARVVEHAVAAACDGTLRAAGAEACGGHGADGRERGRCARAPEA
jgi:predicted Fe-Mo cluster-binding NifX family protein